MSEMPHGVTSTRIKIGEDWYQMTTTLTLISKPAQTTTGTPRTPAESVEQFNARMKEMFAERAKFYVSEGDQFKDIFK